MALPLTISQFIKANQDESASGRFSSVMADIALACRMTASKLRYGNF